MIFNERSIKISGVTLFIFIFIFDSCNKDEFTSLVLKIIITNTREESNMIFTGDIEQTDSPYLDIESDGLSYLSDKMKGQEIFANENLVNG